MSYMREEGALMIPWVNVVVRQREQQQSLKEAEQNARPLAVLGATTVVDRWQWRVMNAMGGWLVDVGCRLQTRVETARQMVRSSRVVAESNSQSMRPCP